MEQDRGLQGLRGVASLQVLFYHIAINIGFLIPLPFLYTGFTGVELFFVISGYILTKKFMAGDYLVNHKFAPIKYYLRRIFRIWPLYMIMVPIIMWTGQIPLVWQDFLFLQNYFWQTFVNNPLWTLCIEELFYLILPMWVWFFTKKWWAALTIFVSLSLIYGYIIGLVGMPSDCLTAGITATGPLCGTYLFAQFPLFAIAYALGTVAAMGKILKLNWVLVAFVWLFALVFLQGINWIYLMFFVFIFYLVVGNLKDHKMFTNRVMLWFGNLTYSIYLLGIPMLYVGLTWFPSHYEWILVDTFGTIGVAYLANRFIEKNFIKLGRKIESKFVEVQTS